MTPEQALDLDRFPLQHPDSPAYQALLAQCQRDLHAHGMFNLDGLLRPEAAAEVAQSLLPRIEQEAFTHEREHNIYFVDSLPELPADHPALLKHKTINHTLCGDQLSDSLVTT